MNRIRVDWLDAVRGSAIIAVVAVHTGFLPLPHLILPFLHSWILPCFFLVGGFFSRPEPFLPWVHKRLKTIVLPYILAGGVSFLGWLMLRETWLGTAISMPVPDALRYWWRGHDLWFNGALWFLPHYFLLQLCLWIYHALPRITYPITHLPLLFIAILLLIHPFVNPNHDHLFYSYDLLPLTLSWALIGVYLQKWQFWRTFSLKQASMIFCIFTGLVLLNGSVDLFARSFGTSVWLYFFSGIFGTAAAASAFQMLGKSRNTTLHALNAFFQFSGKNSLLILITHWPLLQWLTVFFHWLGWLHALSPRPNIIVFSSSSIDQGGLGNIANTTLRLGLTISYTSLCLLVLFIPLYRTLQARQEVRRRTKTKS